MRVELEGLVPQVAADAYVAPTATLIGDVRLAARSSVWFGAVVRGDNEPITIGEGANVQDSSVLHADPGFPLVLEENVTVGHMVVLHGCTVGAGSLIGIGAVVLNGARIGRNCLIAAMALVPEGLQVPDYSIVRGVPGRVAGEVSDKHLAAMVRAARSYQDRIQRYAGATVRP